MDGRGEKRKCHFYNMAFKEKPSMTSTKTSGTINVNALRFMWKAFTEYHLQHTDTHTHTQHTTHTHTHTTHTHTTHTHTIAQKLPNRCIVFRKHINSSFSSIFPFSWEAPYSHGGVNSNFCVLTALVCYFCVCKRNAYYTQPHRLLYINWPVSSGWRYSHHLYTHIDFVE